MMDYTKLVAALRCDTEDMECEGCNYYKAHFCHVLTMQHDAAAAIEVLEAELKRLKDVIDELREAQTYIDHYGDKWMTSAKDVPTSAYNHGYMDGKNEAEAAPPWRRVEELTDKEKDAIFYFEWTGISGTVYRETSIISLNELIALGCRPIAWMEMPEPPKEDV